jgi:hypothetical protein
MSERRSALSGQDIEPRHPLPRPTADEQVLVNVAPDGVGQHVRWPRPEPLAEA